MTSSGGSSTRDADTDGVSRRVCLTVYIRVRNTLNYRGEIR